MNEKKSIYKWLKTLIILGCFLIVVILGIIAYFIVDNIIKNNEIEREKIEQENKRKESNATSELTQVRNVINAYTLEDGSYEYSTYEITINEDKLSITNNSTPITEVEAVTTAIKAIPDLESLSGTFIINDSGDLEYTYEEGIIVIWDISDNSIDIK